MLGKKCFVSVCAVGLFASVHVGSANAQLQGPSDARTEFTFHAPVELPGVTLPSGTYVFRLANASTTRDVLQVIAKDDSRKTYGLFVTIPANRPTPADEAEIRFMETPAGAPVAVKTWWYPGRTTGREFIYPKEQARRLATATHSTVVTTRAETVAAKDMAKADLVTVSDSGQETAVDESSLNAASNVAPDRFDRTPVQESVSAANSSRERLPRTSSLLPLIALMGLSSLAGGAALRFRR